MGGSSKAPEQDPAIGQAALLSAQTGQDMLAWSKSQAAISNGWAAEDRNRYKTTFQPLEDQFIADSKGYDTPERRAAEATRAQGSVRAQGAISRGVGERQLASMGVDPRSGRYGDTMARTNMAEGLAAAGAGNVAERGVEAEGRSRMAQAINLGSGLAVNPGQSLGMATNTGAAGFQGAMSGYGQQANLLNAEYGNRMQAWEANQASQGGLWGGLGSIAGAAISNPAMFSFLSDENVKTNKRPARGALRAVERMRVDNWDYKPGKGDGGSHVGTYSQDFQRETGLGDGKTINVIDAIGTAMGAIKELSKKVDRVSRGIGPAARMAA